ncbi:hypothetical protein [Bythopirellula goksoeyrii]|uniref:hypothetical protein n=1 Tax=Bythopirellula goksoeyrii TaxID=1400387 RepID=UPI0011CEA536|nr:hypothetical protein [Bythopirellula goksoeyrii]
MNRALLLTLTAPEMTATAIVGGMRRLNNNVGQPGLGIFTNRSETLTNDLFVNLRNNITKWQKSAQCEHFFEGSNRTSEEVKWTANAVDLVLGSNSQLRTIAEVMPVTTRSSRLCMTLWLRGIK